MPQIPDAGRRDPGDLLTIAFGTTVTMWGIGYVCRLPGVLAPPWLVGVLLLICMVLGGVATGRYSQRGLRAGIYCGLLTTLLNLLILGSLLTDPEHGRIIPSALWWIPGSLLLGTACGLSGAALGRLALRARPHAPNWPAAFATTAAVGTLLLISVGGVVTGFEAGLAVPDWPNSYGYNMFLYPLSRMTGQVYFEHSHRLFGSLVGLTTLVLGVYLQFVERRRWVRMLALAAIPMVIVQGLLGGLRVTGSFTFSAAMEDLSPNNALAIVHGVLAQIFLGMIVALQATLARTWIETAPPKASLSASTDRVLTVVLIGLVLLQLTLGALVRHDVRTALQIHIAGAAVVLMFSLMVGVRAWGLHEGLPVLPKLGTALLVMVGIQLLLGVAALVVTQSAAPEKKLNGLEVAIATLHQVGGALLLATAVALAAWTRRLLTPSQIEPVESRTAPGGLVES